MYRFTPDPQPRVATLSWGLPSFAAVMRTIFLAVITTGVVVLGVWLYFNRAEGVWASRQASTEKNHTAARTATDSSPDNTGSRGKVSRPVLNDPDLSRFKIEPSATPTPTTVKIPPENSRTAVTSQSTILSVTPSTAAGSKGANMVSNAARALPVIVSATAAAEEFYTPDQNANFPNCLSGEKSGRQLGLFLSDCPVYVPDDPKLSINDYTLRHDGFVVDLADGIYRISGSRHIPAEIERYSCKSMPSGTPDESAACRYSAKKMVAAGTVRVHVNGRPAIATLRKKFLCADAVEDSCTGAGETFVIKVDGGYWLEFDPGRDLTEEEKTKGTIRLIRGR